MASLIAKKKGNQLYYYVVESARVDGRAGAPPHGPSHVRYVGSSSGPEILPK